MLNLVPTPPHSGDDGCVRLMKPVPFIIRVIDVVVTWRRVWSSPSSCFLSLLLFSIQKLVQAPFANLVVLIIVLGALTLFLVPLAIIQQA